MTTDKECCGKCSQPGCTVEQDGTCLEGFDTLTDCPHFVADKEAGGVSRSEPTVKEAPDERETYVALHDGEGLRLDNAGSVMRRSPTKLIVLAGTVDSGKTTLLATLYECFQDGDFGGVRFAGSKTLLGFERRCYLARISCLSEKPETERTKPGDEGVLLHLSTRKTDSCTPKVDMLLTDISGEIFKLIRSSSDECKRHEVIRRADHFVLLFDGAKIADTQLRQENFVAGKTLLRSCLDEGMLSAKTVIDVVITKWDIIDALKNEPREASEKFIEMINEDIQKILSGRSNLLNVYKIAARPEKSDLDFAFGLNEMFECWLEPSVNLLDYDEMYSVEADNLPDRSFGRYGFTRFL